MSKLELADWRSTISDLYSSVRKIPFAQRESAWNQWRETRDSLFREHAMTPLDANQRDGFAGVSYFPYDPEWRKVGRLITDTSAEQFNIPLPEGDLNMTRIARVEFEHQQVTHSLGLYWINGYGGGLFLPFGDKTNGSQTYGGGRYLYDAIKGADHGRLGDEMILDFNFGYNPSCAYNHQWVCPLAPQENKLGVAVEAGEHGWNSAENQPQL